MSFFHGRWPRLISVLILMVLAMGGAWLSSRLGNFYRQLNDFSWQVKEADFKAAQRSLAKLQQSYTDFNFWGMRYLADRFWFRKMFFYQARINYLGEDYEKVISALDQKKEDYQARHLLALAKYRIWQDAYQAEKDPKTRGEMVKKMISEVLDDLGEAVRMGPGPAVDFNLSFNYDLLSDERSAQKALANVRPAPKFVLKFSPAPGAVQKGQKKVPQKGNLPEKLDTEKKAPGTGFTKRRG